MSQGNMQNHDRARNGDARRREEHEGEDVHDLAGLRRQLQRERASESGIDLVAVCLELGAVEALIRGEANRALVLARAGAVVWRRAADGRGVVANSGTAR